MEKTNQLTTEESLHIITSMISQAKGNMKSSSFYFLLWGWTIAIANLGIYVLIKFTDVTNPFLMMSLTIPAAIASVIYGTRQRKKIGAPTLLDYINKWLWIGFGITCLIFVYFGRQIGWQVNPVIITMCAVPTFLSGIMLRFRPLIVGGVIFWAAGVACFLAPVEIQFLLASIAVVLGYLVPGYLLKKSDD